MLTKNAHSAEVIACAREHRYALIVTLLPNGRKRRSNSETGMWNGPVSP